jgi:hypothetical protein
MSGIDGDGFDDDGLDGYSFPGRRHSDGGLGMWNLSLSRRISSP